jgi:hypothetical protein
LRTQDYLKPENRRHGVLVVTHHRDRRWLDVRDKKRISFAELIAWLSAIAATITETTVGPVEVRCVGINAWKDDGGSVDPKPPKKAKNPSANALRAVKERSMHSKTNKVGGKTTSKRRRIPAVLSGN